MTGAIMTSAPPNREMAAIKSACVRYVVVLAGVSLVFLILTIVLWPWPYTFAVEHFVLPEYEVAFGFRGGRVPVKIDDANYTIYALMTVDPAGRLGRSGAISGDIPVEYHGGLWASYAALQDASAGKAAEFSVINQADWPDWGKRRRIVALPTGQAPQR
jgi:hypothetical protein